MLAEIISDIILYKETIESGNFKEAVVRQFIVLPILRALGWRYNEFATLELLPEMSIGRKSVDYALQHNRNPVVLIECKRWGENLGNHLVQLRRYSTQTKADIAILTDGKFWDFYLPDRANVPDNEKVLWQDRMFCSIDLEAQREARENFHKFLSKPNVEQGIAKRAAEEALQPQTQDTPLPRRHYALPILRALNQARGRAPANEVLNRVRELMTDDLRKVDLSQRSDGQTYWKNRTHDMRRELVARGLLIRDSPPGTWEITDAGRESLHPQTDKPLPRSRYKLSILMALYQLDGSAETHVVLKRVRLLMVDELKPIDLESLTSGQPYWENRTHNMKGELVRKGLMKHGSPHGTWEITDAGREYLRNNRGG